MPLSGTWTGFPADSLGMTVEVDVTSAEPADAEACAADENAPAPSAPQPPAALRGGAGLTPAAAEPNRSLSLETTLPC